jgi:carboxypeptidase family protein
MTQFRNRRLLFATLLLACLTPAALLAQGDAITATLAGNVRDPNDAVVPLARVTLRNPGTGFTRDVVTDDKGGYVFTVIPPGRYQLQVEKEGFSTYEHPDVMLTVAQSATINPKLEVGQVGLVVEVTADAPVLNTGNANIGSEVTSEQVVQLPLNIRNVYNLVQLSSGTNNSTEYQGLT